MSDKKFILKKLFCKRILLNDGWYENVRLVIDYNGIISKIEKDVSFTSYDEQLNGPVIPTMPNVHSHAFQYAMAGLAEVSSSTNDSFWTWRELMFNLASMLSPSDIETIAKKLYSELLKGGFGHVAEFHYLHHDKDGKKFDNIGETSLSILSAAETTGIGLTHLPVFYAHSGFDGDDVQAGQMAFTHSVDEYLTLLDHLKNSFLKHNAKLGAAFHSLRAVTPLEMQDLLDADLGNGPIHMHIAAQEREVEECVVWRGRRPVEYLLENVAIDERWCLIHAAHINEDEMMGLVNSGAIIGLCPMTEANHGHSIFRAREFILCAGQIAIGTDSHIATNVGAELQMLEYSQRLQEQKRNRIVFGEGQSVGRTLFNTCLMGGNKAAAIRSYGLRTGVAANLVVLDNDIPFIASAQNDQILDYWIFALGGRGVRDVMINGSWQVVNGKHRLEEEINVDFKKLLKKIQRSL